MDFIYVNPNGQKDDENELTLQVMEKFGWYNVRGGSWCKINLQVPPTELSTRNHLQTFKPQFSPTELSTTFRVRKNISRNNLQTFKPDYRTFKLPCADHINSGQVYNRRGQIDNYAIDCCEESNKPELGYKVDPALLGGSAKNNLGCYRCGRDSHFANDCYAKKDINGDKCDASRSASLSSKASSASLEDDICYRCGRDSHFADDCYAKKDIDGKWLSDR